MPKKKPTLDTRNLKQIVDYSYPEYDRVNLPPVGIEQHDIVASPPTPYNYDPHIDPSLQWAGKKEGTSFEVPNTSIAVKIIDDRGIEGLKVINVGGSNG